MVVDLRGGGVTGFRAPALRRDQRTLIPITRRLVSAYLCPNVQEIGPASVSYQKKQQQYGAEKAGPGHQVLLPGIEWPCVCVRRTGDKPPFY